jgi:hypothetical protein
MTGAQALARRRASPLPGADLIVVADSGECRLYHPQTRAPLGTAATEPLARTFARGFNAALAGARPSPAATGARVPRAAASAYLDGYAAGMPYRPAGRLH